MTTALARRQFVSIVLGAGAGLTLGSKFSPVEASAADTPFTMWVRIEPDDRIIMTLNKVEMGQGVTTGLPTILAEELDAPLGRVSVEFADDDARLYDPIWKMMGTGGSTSVAHMWMPLRTAGATARAMLIAAAARSWGVDPKDCTARDGKVYHAATNRSASYGALAASAATMPVPKGVRLKNADEFTLIGKHNARLDIPAKVNGKARYGMDVRLPGMVYATVVRPPVFGGKLRSFDATAARKVHGVRDVVPISSGVAIVAGNTWSAFQGAQALKVQWDDGPNANLSTTQLFAEAARLSKTRGIVAKNTGNVAGARGTALQATYKVSFLAHAAMEPMNCTADVRAGGCDIYAPTQSQTGTHFAAMKILGFPPARIRVHPTLLGGGFGRRFENDFVADAVELSKKIGKPVKVVWTREADIQHDFYNPMYFNSIRGVLDASGKLIALDHTVVSAGVMKKHFPMPPHLPDPVPMTYAAEIPYFVPNQRTSWVEQDHGIPVGFLRAPGANWNAFVVETFLDELAHEAKADPLAFRLAMLQKAPRMAGVLQLAAEKGGWGNAVEQGHALGLAAAIWEGSFIAVVADVSMQDGMPRVHRAIAAADVGQVVNPEIVVAQVQSGMNYGLGLAMTAKITLKNGRVQESNFFDYTVLRQDAAPVIDVHVVPSTAAPTGVGELGTPPIAPAVANAVFALTGKRVRNLPFKDALA